MHRSHAMPTMHIELFEGRTPEKKRELVRALTERTCEVLGCQPDSVDIILTEISKDRWATGGVLWSEKN
ncbi:MAG: 4-oxalocrotonate tautomerase [Castellaniella sp.]